MRVICVAGAKPTYMKIGQHRTAGHVTEGTNRLVGRDPDRIVAAAREVLAAPRPAAPPASPVRRPALWTAMRASG